MNLQLRIINIFLYHYFAEDNNKKILTPDFVFSRIKEDRLGIYSSITLDMVKDNLKYLHVENILTQKTEDSVISYGLYGTLIKYG